jgi:hypothetical protein
MKITHIIKKLIVLFITLVALIATFFVPPILQNPDYHNFVDQRMLLGIPNFWNVISNLPFVLLGLMGLAYLRRGPMPGGLPELRIVYLTFFAGVLLVGFGSGYYHMAPDNQSLVWDRLPMTISFMTFFCSVVGENINIRAARLMLLPLLLFGMASVLYWYISELNGAGDLRPYFVVQFLPAILIPVILLLFRSRLDKSKYIWALVASYVIAKIVETLDVQIYSLTGFISGHTLKHLIAALGIYFFLLALKKLQYNSGHV